MLKIYQAAMDLRCSKIAFRRQMRKSSDVYGTRGPSSLGLLEPMNLDGGLQLSIGHLE